MQLTSIQTHSWGIIGDGITDIEHGLCAFIGETGSGKSMMIHAILYGLGFIKGDKKWIKNQKTHAEITLNLHVNGTPPSWLDVDDSMIQITRRLHAEGRHKITCQGKLITLQQLKELCEPYFIASTQHSLLQIKDKNKMMAFIDSWMDQSILSKLHTSYQAVKTIEKNIKTQKSKLQPHYELSQLLQSCEEIQQLLQKLDGRDFKEIEDENERYLSKLNEKSHIENCLADIENPQGLNDILQKVKKSTLYLNDEKITELIETISDYSHELGNLIYQKKSNDENVLDHSELITTMNRLCKKHHTLPENIEALYQQQQDQIEQHNLAENLIPQLETERSNAADQYHKTCNIVSKLRQDVCDKITKAYTTFLPQVGMMHALVQWQLTSDENAVKYLGHDEVHMMFQANEGGQLHPVEDIASGGELSRLFLIMQIIKPSDKRLTYIFDEIDTGISGEVAKKVGMMISQLSQQHQVYMISHLPQVACYADQMIYIKKFVDKNDTKSHVSNVSQENHTEVLSKLMSSSAHKTTIEHVQLLLDEAKKTKGARKPAPLELS